MNSRILRFEVHKTVKDPMICHGFVFLAHVPATVRPILARLHLQENRLAIIEEINQYVDF
jgi:hypothetical protein